MINFRRPANRWFGRNTLFT